MKHVYPDICSEIDFDMILTHILHVLQHVARHSVCYILAYFQAYVLKYVLPDMLAIFWHVALQSLEIIFWLVPICSTMTWSADWFSSLTCCPVFSWSVVGAPRRLLKMQSQNRSKPWRDTVDSPKTTNPTNIGKLWRKWPSPPKSLQYSCD